MTLAVAPTQDQVYDALATYLQGVFGAGIPIVRGLNNRTAMPPPVPGFIVMQALFEERLRMAIDTYVTSGTSPPSTSSIEQGLELTVQIDCYGPSAGTWASLISTTFQDTYGCNAIGAALPGCAPLYCNEARMMPLIDEELAYEERYCLTAALQYSPVATVVEQYVADLTLVMKNVEVTFP